MAWQEKTARERIMKLMSDVPQVKAEDLQQFLVEKRAARKVAGLSTEKPLIDVPRNLAVVADTVHVYVNLVNYDEYRLQENRETEASHKKALNFLHLHYAAIDRVIESHSAQRVDFHGPRVHAVVIEPTGQANANERVIAALELAEEMMLLSKLADAEIGNNQFKAEFRIGIDAGKCVAVNSGTKTEPEPLFLGSSANYAAKLSEGQEPGIYISDNVRAILNVQPVRSFDAEMRQMLNENDANGIMKSIKPQSETRARALLEGLKDDFKKHKAATAGTEAFTFHHHNPPLCEIDFEKLMPSNSIRMPLISIFADIDNYTPYIDQATATAKVGQAVRALHVIRGELHNVLKEDFGGRKVRFVGDCIHGLVAEGDAANTHVIPTVRTAARCVAAMRSSFNLCKQYLGDSVPADLGLAIGFELGATPVSRIGIRGDRSVRVASSAATTLSQALQRRCEGDETAIGQNAFEAAPQDVKAIFAHDGIRANFDYPDTHLIMETKSSNPSVAQVSAPTILKAHMSE